MSTKKKQLTLVIALVVVIGLLVWQLWGMMGSDLHSPKAVVAKKSLVKKLSAHTPVPTQWKQKLVISPAEKQYLQLAAQIQKAKMHHQLLQQKVAIAEAEKKLALSHQQAIGLSSSSSEELSTWSGEPTAHSKDLHLLYLAKVSNGRWQATLRTGSTMRHVQLGSALGSGGKVIAIKQGGLWYEDKQGKHWLGFPGEPIPAMPVSSSKPKVIPEGHRPIRDLQIPGHSPGRQVSAKPQTIASTAFPRSDVKVVKSLHATPPSLRAKRSNPEKPKVIPEGHRPIRDLQIPGHSLGRQASAKPQTAASTASPRSDVKKVIPEGHRPIRDLQIPGHSSGRQASAKSHTPIPDFKTPLKILKPQSKVALHQPKMKVGVKEKTKENTKEATKKATKEKQKESQKEKPKKTEFEKKLAKSPDWLSLDKLLHSQPKKELAENQVKPVQSHRLNSDELLFLEQPAEGVTLLTPADNGANYLRQFADNQQMGGSYELTINGKKQLALGLFKSASTARLKALALRQQKPGLQIMPMNVKLLQESVLHG